MAAKAYRVCKKVGLVHPIDKKTRITPAFGTFTPESLCPKDINKGKATIKSWIQQGFVEACLSEVDSSLTSLDDLEIDEDLPAADEGVVQDVPTTEAEVIPVEIGKKIWLFDPETLEGHSLDDLNLMIQDKADQEGIKVPTSHPYKSEKAAIKFLSKDI